jgi:hypothetical protein
MYVLASDFLGPGKRPETLNSRPSIRVGGKGCQTKKGVRERKSDFHPGGDARTVVCAWGLSDTRRRELNGVNLLVYFTSLTSDESCLDTNRRWLRFKVVADWRVSSYDGFSGRARRVGGEAFGEYEPKDRFPRLGESEVLRGLLS